MTRGKHAQRKKLYVTLILVKRPGVGLNAKGYQEVYGRFRRFPARSGWLTSQQTWVSASFAALLVLISIGFAVSPVPLVPLGVFIVLGICVAALIRPYLVVVMSFVCAGLPQLVLSFPGHNMHLIEPVALLCILVVIIRRVPAYFQMPHLVAALFLLLAVISFIHVPQFSSKLSGYGADKRLLELLVIFTAFFCGSILIKYVKSASTLLVTLLLVSIPLYLIGWAQVLGLHLPALLEDVGAQNVRLTQGRLWGPFPWSVNFGMYLINLFAIALACGLLGARRWQRCFGFVMVTITALEMLGTGTRSVAIAAAVVFVGALLLTRRLKLLGFTLLLVGIAFVRFFDKILPLFTHDDTSAANRLFLWNKVLQLIRENPWLGIGLQQFPRYYAQFIVSRATALGSEGIHPHQQYLEWALESGIGWLLLGALLLLSILLVCWRAYGVSGREGRTVLLAALLSVLANIIIGFFDVPMDQLESGFVLFLLAGLACGVASTQSRQVHSGHHGKPARVYAPSSFRERAGLLPTKLVGKKERDTRPTTQKASRSIVIQFVSWCVAVPIIFPMTALLTRYLGPVQYGEYSLTFPFFAIFALISSSGMDPLLIRQLSCQERATWGQLLSQALGTRLFSTLSSIGVAIVVAWLLPVSQEQRSLFLVGSLCLLFSFSFNGLRMIYTHGFRAEQRVGLLSILEMLNRLLTAGLVVVVIQLHLSLFWAYILLVYSDLPMFLFQMVIACKRFRIGIRFSRLFAREYLLNSLPLMGHNALVLLSGQLDLCLLMVFSGSWSVGIYALASRIIDPLLSIVNAYVNGLYPLFCQKFAVEPQAFANTYQEALRVLALIAIPLAVFISAESHTIIVLLGGQQFVSAASAAQWLIWAMGITFFNRLSESACLAAHMERKVVLVSAVSTVVNLLSNIVLIPLWHTDGAAMAALVSEIAGALLFVFLLRHAIRLISVCTVLLLVFLGNVPALFALLYLRDLSLFRAALLALLLMLPGCMATRALSYKDLSMIVHLLLVKRRSDLETAGVPLSKSDHANNQKSQVPLQEIVDYPTLILPRVEL